MYYGSLKMDVCPNEDPAPSFSMFFEQIGREFPVAINLEISPNGLECHKMDQMFAGFFGGFGQHNRSLRDAWKADRKSVVKGKIVSVSVDHGGRLDIQKTQKKKQK